MESLAVVVDKIVATVTNKEETPEQKFLREFDEACSCSRETRFWGFGGCFVIGWVLSIISIFMVPSIALKPASFALIYSLGNGCSLASTCFLFGPCAQIKRMFDKSRAIASFVYLTSIVLTLVVAFKMHSVWLVLLCMVFQFFAMVWYCASYIPGGRTCITNSCKGACL